MYDSLTKFAQCQTLTSKPDQQWYIEANQTKIQIADTTLCMDARPKSAWKDMANISLRPCADNEVGQKWMAMADGRIAVEQSIGTRKFYMSAYPLHVPSSYNSRKVGLFVIQHYSRHLFKEV
jgi:hypothetical protein